MLNQVIIVGRLTSEVEDNKITLAVQRIFKNEEGIYEEEKLLIFPMLTYLVI